MSDAHAKIMNLQCPRDCSRDYKLSHRHARHAAAEIAADKDAEIERLRARIAEKDEALGELRAKIAAAKENVEHVTPGGVHLFLTVLDICARKALEG